MIGQALFFNIRGIKSRVKNTGTFCRGFELEAEIAKEFSA
jgi:hypothetical protein